MHSTPPPDSIFQFVHGDFDNDGDEDVAYTVGGQLEVRRNDGAAGFAAPLVLTPGVVRDYVVTDLDRDGWLDLATVTSTSLGGTPPVYQSHVRVWRNGGPAAGFVAFTQTNVVLLTAAGGLGPTIVAADFDSDGLPDVAAHDGIGTLWVLRGAGSHGVPSGTFLPPVAYPFAVSYMNLVAADLNLDGAIDIAGFGYTQPTMQLRVLEGLRGPQGQPLGTFGPVHATAMPAGFIPNFWSMSCGDFDGDGLLDVLVSDQLGAKLFRNAGAFAFAPPVAFAVPGVASPYFPRAFTGDFDRDGRLDIAAPTETHYLVSPGNFHVLRDPLGAAAWSSYSVGPGYPVSGAAIDLDNNGVLDAAIGKGYHSLTSSFGTCSVLPPPGIAVVQPNGGEFLLAGQQTTIQWTAATQVAAFDVDVSFDDGATWTPVARQVTGTSCPWWVHEPSTNRARFRVMPVGLPVFADTSNGPVTIGGPGLASAVPLGNGCGQPFVPTANATVPHLGGTTRLELLGASPNVLAAWWLSVPIVPPLPVPGGIGCFVWLDPAMLGLLALSTTDGSGRYALDVPVPGNPALQGLSLAAQATAFVPASPLGMQISNGVGLLLGF